ncbi:uncharacterized protein LOC142587575 isoform X2 [Dermacentor variabilis]|uniref:uncharacterized protein LOC142587575 isoform X2 n=1 Tax=Dermacentor variabilis TaxID=34621 RepID=UPI003F5B7BFD
MEGRKLLSAFLLIFTFMLSQSSGKVYNLKKFVGTKLPIWTYLTTDSRQCLCQVDLIQSMKEKEIIFTYYFLDKHQKRKHQKLVGVFDKKDVMYVRVYGSQNELKEEIEYLDKVSGCAVLHLLSMSSYSGPIFVHKVLLEESMEESKFISAVVFATYFITLECKLPTLGFGKHYSIREFLSTTLPIWTHTTTVGGGDFCEVDQILQIANSTITYTHSSYHMLHGKQMKFLSHMVGDFEKPEDMYAYEKGRKSIELRVWNSSIHAGPSPQCVKYYHSIESHGRGIYTHACQKILSYKNASPQPHQQLLGKAHPLHKGPNSLG